MGSRAGGVTLHLLVDVWVPSLSPVVHSEDQTIKQLLGRVGTPLYSSGSGEQRISRFGLRRPLLRRWRVRPPMGPGGSLLYSLCLYVFTFDSVIFWNVTLGVMYLHNTKNIRTDLDSSWKSESEIHMFCLLQKIFLCYNLFGIFVHFFIQYMTSNCFRCFKCNLLRAFEYRVSRVAATVGHSRMVISTAWPRGLWARTEPKDAGLSSKTRKCSFQTLYSCSLSLRMSETQQRYWEEYKFCMKYQLFEWPK